MKLEIERWVPVNKGGHEYVYLFYYPAYRDLAFYNDVTQWPCKIGRSTIDPITRISQQLNSSSPELPVIGAVFQCDDSQELEATIHHYLKLHHRFFHHPFNQEWFNTNPDEIVSVVKTLAMEPDDVFQSDQCE